MLIRKRKRKHVGSTVVDSLATSAPSTSIVCLRVWNAVGTWVCAVCIDIEQVIRRCVFFCRCFCRCRCHASILIKSYSFSLRHVNIHQLFPVFLFLFLLRRFHLGRRSLFNERCDPRTHGIPHPTFTQTTNKQTNTFQLRIILVRAHWIRLHIPSGHSLAPFPFNFVFLFHLLISFAQHPRHAIIYRDNALG